MTRCRAEEKVSAFRCLRLPSPSGEFGASASDEKRARGRYFTAANLFDAPHFRAWAADAGLPRAALLEPFAGGGDLLAMLADLGLRGDFYACDLLPAAPGIVRRDSLADFPRGFSVVVTNPPWLARNSATRRGLPFPQTRFDDLYKHCVDLCLRNAGHLAAIVPASFLVSGLFRRRLRALDVAGGAVFRDTENPVCLALFGPESSDAISIYQGGVSIGELSELERHLPAPSSRRPMRFNDPDGDLGLIAIDNTRGPSIRFCEGRELADYWIGGSSRMITRISTALPGGVSRSVALLNRLLDDFRESTADAFLTPFKGLRKDGKYRRRLNFALARDFVDCAR